MVWPDSRGEIEAGMERDLTRALRSVAEENPGEINEQRIEEAVTAVAEPWLATTAEDAIAAILLLLDDRLGGDALGGIRSSLMADRLVSSQGAAQLLGRQVAANTRQMVDRMRRENLRQALQKGKTFEDAQAGLSRSQRENVYGAVRAQRIAITETTRMSEIAEKAAVEVLQRSGVAVRRKWITERDRRVCPVCKPLDGVPEHEWPSAYRNGPPAHVGCRCVAQIINLDELVR